MFSLHEPEPKDSHLTHPPRMAFICYSPLGFLSIGPYGDRFANFRHYRGVEVKVRFLPRRRHLWRGGSEEALAVPVKSRSSSSRTAHCALITTRDN